MAKSDFLPWDDALRVVDYLKKEKQYQWLSLFSLGIFSGLRIGDILKLQWKDIKPVMHLTEEKTKKNRAVTIKKDTLQLLATCKKELNAKDTDKVVPFTSQYCSRKLKTICGANGIWGINISNHTLRKTFARQVWESNGKSESSLVLLSDILNHSSISITRVYLGIRDEEISAAYLSLSLKKTKTVK